MKIVFLLSRCSTSILWTKSMITLIPTPQISQFSNKSHIMFRARVTSEAPVLVVRKVYNHQLDFCQVKYWTGFVKPSCVTPRWHQPLSPHTSNTNILSLSRHFQQEHMVRPICQYEFTRCHMCPARPSVPPTWPAIWPKHPLTSGPIIPWQVPGSRGDLCASTLPLFELNVNQTKTYYCCIFLWRSVVFQISQ